MKTRDVQDGEVRELWGQDRMKGLIERRERLPSPPDVVVVVLLEGRLVVLLPPLSSPPSEVMGFRDGARDVGLLMLFKVAMCYWYSVHKYHSFDEVHDCRISN